MAGGRKPGQRSHDIASRVRGAFLRAMQINEEDTGKGLSEIIAEQMIDRPLETLNAISKFVPKEMLIEQTLEITLAEMSDEAIDGEIARLVGETAATGLIARASQETQH